MSEISIVSIGGGPLLGAEGHLNHAIDMTGVSNPNVLIVPTPSSTLNRHAARVNTAGEFFGKKLGLPIDVLHEFDAMPESAVLSEKLEWADFAYITAGNSLYAMAEWKEYGVDKLLKEKALGGLVLAGISAGAIAPFAWGQSDPYTDRHANSGEYVAIDALNVVPVAVAPHFDRVQADGDIRGDDFPAMFENKNKVRPLQYGFGIDNHAALVVHDGVIAARSSIQGGVTLFEMGEEEIHASRLGTTDTVNIPIG